MKLIFTTLLAAVWMLAPGCKTDTSSNWKRTEVQQEVEAMLHSYFDDIRESGLTAEFAYLDSTEDFFWVPPGYGSALNYDSVRTILEYNAPTLTAVNFQWNELSVYPLSAEIATYTGVVSGKIVDTAGMQSNVNMIESGTAIKRRDGWKILSGQSRDFPGVSTR